MIEQHHSIHLVRLTMAQCADELLRCVAAAVWKLSFLADLAPQMCVCSIVLNWRKLSRIILKEIGYLYLKARSIPTVGQVSVYSIFCKDEIIKLEVDEFNEGWYSYCHGNDLFKRSIDRYDISIEVYSDGGQLCSNCYFYDEHGNYCHQNFSTTEITLQSFVLTVYHFSASAYVDKQLK